MKQVSHFNLNKNNTQTERILYFNSFELFEEGFIIQFKLLRYRPMKSLESI